MNDIEKDLFRKTVAIKTTSLKPAEYSVLSEDKSIRADETFPLSSGSLSRIEKVLRHHRKAVSLIQWLVVLLYFSLLLLPALSGNFIDERVYDSISDFSRLIFWGTGWPLIVLSMMVCGRIWCGLFCPDGTLTEFISRHGQKRSIPRWIRWKGWPCTVLTGTVLYGQLIAVYDNFPATLVLLGIPTCLALLTGFLYGNGKRIWCMYLCPGNGIFGLLARLSPIYYKVDREKWEQYSGQQERLDCPTLINVRQMQGMSGCHACGRCLGHRNAVELGFRSPSSEIVTTPENRISGSELFLLLWGVTGICTAALAWRGNVLYSQFILRLAQLDVLAASDLPWWLSAIESVSPDFHHHQRLGTGTDDIRPASSGCSCLRQWHPVETIGALPDSCHWLRYFSGHQPDRFFTLGSLWISFRVYTCTSIHDSDCSIPVFSLAGHQNNFWTHSSCQHDRVFYLLPVCCLACRCLVELFSDIKKACSGKQAF